MAFLENLAVPGDLKKLGVKELSELAEEIREEIIAVVSRNGGHLASSLGVVELTLALHYIYDAPKDRIIWDVGHQAYTHKIITGRRGAFHTLRTENGISGFPKRSESPYDAFDVGHSSTSISAALGMAVARDARGEDHKVVAVIGDGSMTAGLAFEGLNQAGHLKRDLVVVLNDNEMSISNNVGALSNYLSRIITGERAEKLRRDAETFLKKLPPRFGETALRVATKTGESIKGLFAPGMLFEEMGFSYVGPIDGHDLPMLLDTLKAVRGRKGPVLVHVLTKKGKGYVPAEDDPTSFHGTPPFDVESGEARKGAGVSYTGVFGDALIELAEKAAVVAISAAMPEGTGLSRFAEKFPGRFFDVGIAEQHGITFATGLAAAGLKPVTAIYSTFLQRSYDQVVHDLCMQKLPVVIAMDRAGIVGEDGETHQGLFDISYLRHVPNLVFMAPKDENELRHMLFTALRLGCPVALRYPRGKGEGVAMDPEPAELPLGRAEALSEGSDLTIIAVGNTVHPSVKAADALSRKGYSVGVVNARFIKPIDRELVLKVAAGTKRVMTVEENVLAGGFGSLVLEVLEEAGVSGVSVRRLGVPDIYVEQGTQAQIRRRLGLDAQGIEERAFQFLSQPHTEEVFIENS